MPYQCGRRGHQSVHSSLARVDNSLFQGQRRRQKSNTLPIIAQQARHSKAQQSTMTINRKDDMSHMLPRHCMRRDATQPKQPPSFHCASFLSSLGGHQPSDIRHENPPLLPGRTQTSHMHRHVGKVGSSSPSFASHPHGLVFTPPCARLTGIQAASHLPPHFRRYYVCAIESIVVMVRSIYHRFFPTTGERRVGTPATTFSTARTPFWCRPQRGQR